MRGTLYCRFSGLVYFSSEYCMKTQKHAELIKAWADGAIIQAKYNQTWVDLSTPQWDENSIQYRIKPEEKQPVVRWKWAYKTDNSWVEMTRFMSESEVPSDWIIVEYTRMEFPE